MTNPWTPAQNPGDRVSPKANTRLFLGLVVAIAILFVITRPAQPASQDSSAGTNYITGTFVSWQAVDDANGYANFTVTNNGATAAVAKCTVSVRNDFGNFGFEVLVGETLAAGQTRSLRLPISVGKGSRLINQGTVHDC